MKKTIEDILIFVTVLSTFFGLWGGLAWHSIYPGEFNGVGYGIMFGAVAGIFISAFYNEEEKDEK